MFWISPLLAAVSRGHDPAGARRHLPRSHGGPRSSSPPSGNSTGTLNGLVEETHTGHALVQVFGRRGRLWSEFARQNRRLYRASFRAQFLSGVIQPSIQFLATSTTSRSRSSVATGSPRAGCPSATCWRSSSTRGSSCMPVTQMASQMNLLQSGLASAERVFEFLDAPEESAGSTEAEAAAAAARSARTAGRVTMAHVCFRYEPDQPLLEDFSLDVAPGQTIAIVGPSGAGKTTVVNLLMRFYEIDSGRITLDGTDYRELSRDQVRRCFGMVLQDTWLFAGTIRDNIGYGLPGATDEQILAAAKAAYVDSFVQALPEGYDTILDEDAANISSGQKQLLTIARAFLAHPAILILDEATSNVDTRTEVLIQEAMARLRRGRTSFVIAHRLSTIRNADTIIVMDACRIVEHGRHDDLLGRRGFYYGLYDSQFTGAFAA